ncbi:hypothetical protein PLESTB_000345400 [Pleodorina starrii]|uniref:Uncharacterized protein n=1 Tax=Pleodorina starrii TaxID=330485 RepID=A0A9W6EZC1_9CHLO|nr:hypothetical protein PLESTM_000049400 [Pleodorina starrii]GLC50130.1 hypothetical protein PLESTB_000345400 [Pleodorina starrii]GLC73090.1 hypothetical protein PLESTF_001331000 [Pleodorina starrii]
MTGSSPHWTNELYPLAACGLLSKLPELRQLRQRADAAVALSIGSSSTSTSISDAPGAELLFHSSRLYDAVRVCVEQDPDIAAQSRQATTLLLASVAMEDYVRSHSTKARLVTSQFSRIARAAAEQAAEAARSEASQDSDAELVQFFTRSGRDQVIDRLLKILEEPESQRQNLSRVVAKYSAVDLAAIVKATKRSCETGDTQRVDGSGPRTLGGVFFREAKRYKASISRAEVSQLLPPPPPLRPYQRDVVGLMLASWGLQATEEVLGRCEEDGAEGGEGGPQEGAQARLARFRALAGGWGGNWLVSAPTNSGKTRMFIEVARGIIASRPPHSACAVVVVLVPNVILTTQHAVAFDSAGLPRTVTGAYSSDNPLSAKAWRAICIAASGGGHHSVVVATAESFLNLLRISKAFMEEVDLLVLDEAHHCKDDHPYAQIMETFYKPPPPPQQQPNGLAVGLGAKRTRVLGVTASPASERDMATLDRRMEELLLRLGPARLHLVDSDDPRVAAVLPEPSRVTARVARRPVDRELMHRLQDFALDAALEIDESLAQVTAVGGTATEDRDQLAQALHVAISACDAAPPGQLLVTRLDPLGQWLSRARNFAARYRCNNLDLTCRLLDVLRKAVELIEDAGFDGALPFLSRKAAVLCSDELAINGGVDGAGSFRAHSVVPFPPAIDTRRHMMVGAAAGAAANGAAARAMQPLAAVQGGGGGGGLPQILASLAGAAVTMPSAHELAVQLEAARVAEGSAPPGNSCPDITLRASKLIKGLLMGEGGLLSNPEMGELLPECFASGELKENTFPKFWALVTYLQRYRDRTKFHGIIFVRTRQAVFHVTDMIRRTLQLQFLEVLELIGHNNTSKRSSLAPEQDRHGRGMNDSQQQQVLRLFKEPGRKVLVATSAAEEGLDVPSCEFVVRYNAAATGIQLLQSRGRARQRVAEFFAILQDGTLDTDLHAKSRQEEANMHEWQRTVAAANRGLLL